MFFFFEKDESVFEDIKHSFEDGTEYWYARELQTVLEYSDWRNFTNVIDKARIACENSGIPVEDHFVDVTQMVDIGSGAERKVNDIQLSRYACYLIMQNGDPRKEVIAIGQTYFAVKTRQQEIIENYDILTENQKRLAIRNEIIAHNKALAEAAKQAGITEPMEYAVFQNWGYKGLYGGMDMRAIHKHKGLKKSQKILDHMGSTELAANLFRATQTEEKLRREQVQGKIEANRTHYEVGKKVRETIQELGGTMPEDLPTPEKSIKQIEREQERKQLKEKK
ncbi:MAG: DNA damage-inducible protein D [Oscillospiraceae bacterium]|nr:DNA damage-inducible protein D [Oscillospiraceae bacterium]